MVPSIERSGWHDEPDVAFLMMSCEALVCAAEAFPKSTLIDLDKCVRRSYGRFDSASRVTFMLNRPQARADALANARTAVDLLVEAGAIAVQDQGNDVVQVRLTLGAWAALNSVCAVSEVAIDNQMLWETLADWRVPQSENDKRGVTAVDTGKAYLAAALSMVLKQPGGPLSVIPR